MFFEMSDGQIETLEACVKKDLLAYVSYPGGKRCLSFPQFCFDGGTVSRLAPAVFPDRGCLPMAIASDLDSRGMFERFGEVVVMTINRNDIKENHFYGDGNNRDALNGVINPTFAKGASQIEFTRLNGHALSTRLVQVVNLTETVRFDVPSAKNVHVCANEAQPMTRLVLVAQASDGRRCLYGPFECAAAKGGGYSLTALGDCGSLVAAIEEDAFQSRMELVDDRGMAYATFVDASEMRDRVAAAAQTYDWIGDDELNDAIGRLARLDAVGLSKGQARALKDAIAACADADAKIAVSPARRRRMEGLLDGYLSWAQLAAEDRRSAIGSADPAELAAFVLDDANFATFFDRVIEDGGIRRRVDEQRRQLTAETERLEGERDEARRQADAVRGELDGLTARRDELKRALLEEATAEVEAARRERDGLQGESERLRRELGELDDQRAVIEDKVRRLVRSMSDETVASEKILEFSMMQQIHAALSAPDHASAAQVSRAGAPAAPAPLPLLALGKDDAAPARLLEVIAERTAAAAGRELPVNEVANLLVCVMQGYVTTLSGLPGTGKTSLANALGAALGLKNPAGPRFVQVGVERGWTSYKDLVGYFNPLTGTMVKSCPELFDLLVAADAEERAGGVSAPWLILLDEANLSSVEHYWSPFLGSCDSFMQRPVALALGTDAPLLVPRSARFIATVNFDHTTEELSPRFLDRSWVISLEPGEIEMDAVPGMPAGLDLDVPAIGFGDLCDAFAPQVAPAMPDAFRARLREVAGICARHHAPVSARSQQMMARYIAAASRVMDTSSAEASYAPVDYAVAQKVLPTLSGPEDRLRGLVDDLMGVGGLPMTRRHLERMSKAGEDSGFIQFFA